jgi:hypothetical protein
MILAVEADGAAYRDSGSVRDRDRLRKEHLERLGWRVHRLWSTSWFADPEAELARLRAAYDQAVAASPLIPDGEPEAEAAAGPAAGPAGPAEPVAEPVTEPAAEAVPLAGRAPEAVASPGRRRELPSADGHRTIVKFPPRNP